MRNIVFILLAVITCAACTNYGKKVTIEGTKGEVYYKGEGVTEADALKLGNYLKEDIKYFRNDKKLSVRLAKSNEEGYDVSFVVDEKKLNESEIAMEAFKKIGAAISIDLYDEKPVHVLLTDDHFKEIKRIPFDKDRVNAMKESTEENSLSGLTKDDFDHGEMDGINFYWRGVSDEESKRIADYIVENGSFRGGPSEIYMTLEDGRYILRFPVVESARTDETYLAKFEKVTKDIKDNVFAGVPYSFYVTDEKLNRVRSWDY